MEHEIFIRIACNFHQFIDVCLWANPYGEHINSLFTRCLRFLQGICHVRWLAVREDDDHVGDFPPCWSESLSSDELQCKSCVGIACGQRRSSLLDVRTLRGCPTRPSRRQVITYNEPVWPSGKALKTLPNNEPFPTSPRKVCSALLIYLSNKEPSTLRTIYLSNKEPSTLSPHLPVK